MSVSDPRELYRIPNSLRDLVMIDLLELTGSTTAAAEVLNMSQPNVSRRYRSVARDLDLVRNGEAPIGCRFGHTPWLTMLRRGANHHRLNKGVLRIGSRRELEPLLASQTWAHWVRLGQEQLKNWRSLLALELLDAMAVIGLPELTDEDAEELVLVEVRPKRDGQVVLICRQDPLVLEICSCICQ